MTPKFNGSFLLQRYNSDKIFTIYVMLLTDKQINKQTLVEVIIAVYIKTKTKNACK